MAGERTPLISNGQSYLQTSYGGSTDSDLGEDVSCATTAIITDSGLLPPPYTPSQNGVPMVTCRVCQSMIDISGKVEQHVVKCSKCKEATPIKSAPPGKKYVRCPCDCLLICRAGSPRIACPRPNCKRIINLQPSTTPGPTVPNLPGMCRVKCVHCEDTFIFNTLNNALARCPHCRRVSSVGPDFARCRSITFSAICITLFFTAIIVIVTTMSFTQQHPGIYVAYVGIFLIIAALSYRVYYFCTMKSSTVEGPL